MCADGAADTNVDPSSERGRVKLSYEQEVELYHACIDAQDFGPLNDYIQEQNFPFRVCMVGVSAGGTLLFSNQMILSERLCKHNRYWNLGRNNACATIDLKVKKFPEPAAKVPNGHLFVQYCPHCDYDPTNPIEFAHPLTPWRTVSVTDFGAKCDGVTDDSAAMQRAFDSRADVITIPQTPEGMLLESQVSFNGDGSIMYITDEASSLPDRFWESLASRTLKEPIAPPHSPGKPNRKRKKRKRKGKYP